MPEHDPYSDQLRRLNRKVDLSNILQAGQLIQEQRLIAQNQQMLNLNRQRLAEERIYRFKMWLQSQAGQAYRLWQESATRVVAGIRAFDEAWTDAWRSEVDRVISTEERTAFITKRYLPTPTGVSAKRLLHPLGVASVLVLAVLVTISQVLSRTFDTGFWSALATAALVAGALAWTLLYDDSEFRSKEAEQANRLRHRRIEYFGVDPLVFPPPGWSVDNEHTMILDAIEHTISTAPVTFPDARELPPITVPRLIADHTVRLEAHKGLLATDYFRLLSSDLMQGRETEG